ncbi:MAG: DNA-3-methyladenine glycosylase I [SAR202 cluster bacterium]|nr:DNA-3-methyladenine glycosylase I [SAR202 cluster bacterium]MDP6512046.1 DNA-3-methyladenine glycosylase I [SAR202 cluster bacterium]MDP6713310.1 DNA-3-methyladenine glycosylase I [SAR202 cluster bacterium]
MEQTCGWAGSDILKKYHDEEWGVPVHDDQKLFEALILDGAQAGLSWETILKKREGYRLAFDNFDPSIVAQYDDAKAEELRQDVGIVRNRQKIASAIKNAKAFLEVQREFGSFDAYLWSFVDGQPIVNSWTSDDQIPATSDASETLSKDLKSRGFNFVGPTIIYAAMQALGMVNDHLVTCIRYSQVADGER